ncbi:hypothetical protein BN871_DE_00120 [Paenibacillus sp. P22]|nr:hypothetical protein BN871_DE_00120 [Paenibacillus sp. P22]
MQAGIDNRIVPFRREVIVLRFFLFSALRLLRFLCKRWSIGSSGSAAPLPLIPFRFLAPFHRRAKADIIIPIVYHKSPDFFIGLLVERTKKSHGLRVRDFINRPRGRLRPTSHAAASSYSWSVETSGNDASRYVTYSIGASFLYAALAAVISIPFMTVISISLPSFAFCGHCMARKPVPSIDMDGRKCFRLF